MSNYLLPFLDFANGTEKATDLVLNIFLSVFLNRVR